MSKALSALAAVAMAGAVLVPTVAQANDMDSVVVSYADLNLASAVGQRALNQRVAVAADSLCGFADGIDYSVKQAAAGCRSAAIDGAQPAVASAINLARHGSVTVLGGAALIVSAR